MSRDFPIGPFGPRISIDSDGVWLVDGDPVVHPTVLGELVERLDRRPDGVHVIRAGGGELAIEVTEAPFVVRTLDVGRGPDGRVAHLRALLSDGTEEPIDPRSFRRVAAPAADPEGARLACTVKGGRFEARLSRFATYQLLAAAEPAADGRARLETAHGAVVF
jgi:hypothetical protein